MKVTLLYSKYISDPTGASAVMRYLKESMVLFRNKGIIMNYFTRDTIIPKKENQNEHIDTSIGAKGMIMQFLKRFSKTNSICALLHQYIRSGRAAKVLVKRYLSQSTNDDIVFIHEIDTCYYYLKYIKNQGNVKVILVSHSKGDLYGMTRLNYPCLCSGLLSRCLYRKEEYVLSHIDRLGFVSQTSMENFKNRNSAFDQSKLFYNLNGIPDIGIIKKEKDCNCNVFNIACVGTVNERKGQRFIIEALADIPVTQRKKMHINIIGDGELKNELEKYCADKSINQYITFWGSRKDVSDLLRCNDIFILPSLDEGLPIAILEAMRQGLPIVSTMVGGIPEMIEEGANGVFIKPSTEGVKSVLMNLDYYDWERMGRNSRCIFLNKFSLESMVAGYSNVFKSIDS